MSSYKTLLACFFMQYSIYFMTYSNTDMIEVLRVWLKNIYPDSLEMRCSCVCGFMELTHVTGGGVLGGGGDRVIRSIHFLEPSCDCC